LISATPPPNAVADKVHDALAGERLGKAADLVHQPARSDGRVVRERLVTGVYLLEHGRRGEGLGRDQHARIATRT